MQTTYKINKTFGKDHLIALPETIEFKYTTPFRKRPF